MNRSPFRSSFPWIVSLSAVLAPVTFEGATPQGRPAPAIAQAEEAPAAEEREAAARVQYLEIVTPDVDATCANLGALHGVEFSDPVPMLGGARTARLEGGGRIGVRGPLRPDESPVVRPYLLVDDVAAAVKAAEEAGAAIAHPPFELEGHGTFAIFIQGGIEHGLWQL